MRLYAPYVICFFLIITKIESSPGFQVENPIWGQDQVSTVLPFHQISFNPSEEMSKPKSGFFPFVKEAETDKDTFLDSREGWGMNQQLQLANWHSKKINRNSIGHLFKLWHMGYRKKRSLLGKRTLLRIGKRSKYSGKEKRSNSLLRVGKRSNYKLRIGKRGNTLLRIGKRSKPILRIGKRERPMLRIGKREKPLLRIGKRERPLLRIGKRGKPMLRIGKREKPLLRIGKREKSLLRIGKREKPLLRIGKREKLLIELAKQLELFPEKDAETDQYYLYNDQKPSKEDEDIYDCQDVQEEEMDNEEVDCRKTNILFGIDVPSVIPGHVNIEDNSG